METEVLLPEPIEKIAKEIETGYEAENVPLGSYLLLMGAYSLFFAALYKASSRGRDQFEKPKGLDLALLTIASYKFSRVITMSFIGSAVRAPFTKRGPSLKAGEVQDQARGRGLQRAIGNMVTCPFCFNVWSTTLFVFGYSISKKLTTQVAYVLSIAAAGDFLHLGYRNVRELSR
jgi:hypothetical protein